MMHAVLLEVIANSRAIGYGQAFVENCTMNTAMPSDRAIVQNDRVFDGEDAAANAPERMVAHPTA